MMTYVCMFGGTVGLVPSFYNLTLDLSEFSLAHTHITA